MAEDKGADSENQGGEQESSNNVSREDFEKLKTELFGKLEEERKASSGKDKKIAEYQAQIKKFQESTMSKDKLLEMKEQELNEKAAEFEKRQAAIEAENAKERRENMVNRVVAKYSDKYPGLIRFAKRIQGNSEEEIEIDIKEFVKDWSLDQNKRDNVKKVGPKPQSGEGKQAKLTPEDFMEMDRDGKIANYRVLTPAERDRMFDDIMNLPPEK